MHIVTAVFTGAPGDGVAKELVAQVRAQLGERRVDLCIMFASAHFAGRLDAITAELHEALSPISFIGTTGEAVICGEVEYEQQPALSLWAATLPDAHVASFHLSQDELNRLTTPASLREYLNVPSDEEPSFILMGDPFSIDVLGLLERLTVAYPGRPVIGGMASAGEAPGENALIFDGQALRHGLSGVAIWGNAHLDTVVSQGCRPIGRPLVITKAERNVIYQLGGRPPLQVVRDLLAECPPRDRELVQTRGLLVGRVINEYQQSFARGDFLIRNPLRIDPSTGEMVVNDIVRTGQTIQFHVRDGESAGEDLDLLLAGAPHGGAAGALLFSCNGRGTRLFSDRNHDARAIQQRLGGVPLAGFFCAGEIGPIGQRNFLHGHTASIGFLRPQQT